MALRAKPLARVAFCLLIALCVLSSAGAAPLTSNPATMPMAFSTSAHGSNAVPAGKSPTTGLEWSGEYRPIMVQISNQREARPHWNLSEADVVYESILWAPGHTRYTAVYNDNHPSFVGSVRSLRWHHCELREEWDCPIVFWGGQITAGTSIYDFFTANKVSGAFRFDGTRNPEQIPYGPALDRETTRVSPHNAVANLQYLVENVWPTKADGSPYMPKSHAFSFSVTPTRGQDTAKEIYICYDEKDYFPSYTFNSASRQYERWYNGEEQYDGKSSKRIVASNVIVQFCKLEYYAGSAQRPLITTTHGGIMDAFIDGQHIRGSWVRNSLPDRTIFLDAGGKEIIFLPGKTFIQIVPESFEYTYVTENGAKRTASMGGGIQREAFEDEGDIAELNMMD